MVHIFYYIFLTSTFETILCAVYVNTKLGNIKGISMLSRDGRKFSAFLGVPYAQSPIGDLRFKNPSPVKPWNTTLDATSYPPICPQLTPAGFKGDENCLTLNIYTPQVGNTSRLPVLFFIHGGRRAFGHVLPFKYGPEYLMDRSIVMVTVAYRLGALGYLSTEDATISGNYALKDQAMALQWIRDYIRDFGGDPTNVTLNGSSSGAADGSLHLFSPLSKGLFHRCIFQSGQLLNFWTMSRPGVVQRRTWAFARLVGCNAVRTSEQLLKCLRFKPAELLVRASARLMYDYVLPDSIFGPVIEHKYVDGAFLTVNPAVAIEKSISIPCILGVTQDEGSLGTLALFSNSKAVNHVVKEHRRIFPELYGYDGAFNPDYITDVILKKYFRGNFSRQSVKEFSEVFGSSHAYVGAIETALQYKGPTYFYLYEYNNHPSYIRNYMTVAYGKNRGMSAAHNTGVVHGEELMSIFNYPNLFPPIIKGEDRIVSDQILSFWQNFITFGNPNGLAEHQIWKPVTSKNLEYLHFHNLRLDMRNKLLWDDYQFWKRLGQPVIIKKDSHIPLWNS